MEYQFSPRLGEYSGGTHFTSFILDALTCRKVYKSGTVWKVQKDMTTQWSIERKDLLDSHGIFIDATLDPSCSLPSTFFDALR